mmetsp:Transcript_82419/g.215102  ORF Transcript_82419/g.215102 Transcript_82419/m.215102 type:complete len:250 (+) Transcript_82419:152-901(+)
MGGRRSTSRHLSLAQVGVTDCSVPRRLCEPANLKISNDALGDVCPIYGLVVRAHAHLGPGELHGLPSSTEQCGSHLVVDHPVHVLGAVLLKLLPARLPGWSRTGTLLDVQSVPVALALRRDVLQRCRVGVEPQQPADVRAAQHAQTPHGHVQVFLSGQVLADSDFCRLVVPHVRQADQELAAHGRRSSPLALPGVPVRSGQRQPEVRVPRVAEDHLGLVGPVCDVLPWLLRVRSAIHDSHTQKLIGVQN